MHDLDHLVSSVLSLVPQADAPFLEVRVTGAEADTLRSLEGDLDRTLQVRRRLHEAMAPRSVSRVLVCGHDLRLDVVLQAPSAHVPLRSGERLIV